MPHTMNDTQQINPLQIIWLSISSIYICAGPYHAIIIIIYDNDHPKTLEFYTKLRPVHLQLFFIFSIHQFDHLIAFGH